MKLLQTLLPFGLLITSIAVVALSPFSAPRGIADQTNSNADIDLRYARALSELAKHELNQATAENESRAGVNTIVVLQRLKSEPLRMQRVMLVLARSF